MCICLLIYNVKLPGNNDNDFFVLVNIRVYYIYKLHRMSRTGTLDISTSMHINICTFFSIKQ